MRRLLGVDLGERRIGLAIGDAQSGAARALATIARRTLEQDAATLRRLAAEQEAVELVVGLPLEADGREGLQAERTRAWAQAVGPLVGLPVAWRDERYTSLQAEARLGPTPRGRSGGPPSRVALGRRRAAVDREAARLILQAELDARAGLRP